MISVGYVRTMAAYNAEMNRRLYAAAERLCDRERRLDRGAFWHSIHGTLSHMLWADRMWMSRLAGWEKPARDCRKAPRPATGFPELAAARGEADAKISAWAADLQDDWLRREQTWFSGAHREITAPRGMLMMHFFSHQTHHRGQAHAMLTAAGQRIGDTDLLLVVPGRLDRR